MTSQREVNDNYWRAVTEGQIREQYERYLLERSQKSSNDVAYAFAMQRFDAGERELTVEEVVRIVLS